MLIGIDGGGTKTLLVLAEDNGTVVNTFAAQATNVADFGFEEAVKRLTSQLGTLLYGYNKSLILSVYAGIAGAGNALVKEQLNTALSQLFPGTMHTDCDTDAFNPLYGEAEEGIVLIAGTGSSAFAVNKNGRHQVGGWGYLIDDAGSGFSVGSKVLKAAYSALDGRGCKTMLNAMCEEKLASPLSLSVPAIYNGGKSFIASFAPLAFEAAEKGDTAALQIVREAAEALALHIKTCLRFTEARPACTIMSGGLMKNSFYYQLITENLAEVNDDISIVHPQLPQVYGALAKAAMNAGIAPDNTFKTNFTASYKEN